MVLGSHHKGVLNHEGVDREESASAEDAFFDVVAEERTLVEAEGIVIIVFEDIHEVRGNIDDRSRLLKQIQSISLKRYKN